MIKYGILVFFVYLQLLSAQNYFGSGPQNQSATGQTDWVGKPAPNFVLPDTSHQYYFLSKYCRIGEKKSAKKNQIVVLSFFASWCLPCRKEIPELTKFADSIKSDSIQFFLINVADTKSKLRNFLAHSPTTLPILMDRYKVVSEKYGVTSLPRLVVIDKNGIIRAYFRGFQSSAQFREKLWRIIFQINNVNQKDE